jgi:hypothetical protein
VNHTKTAADAPAGKEREIEEGNQIAGNQSSLQPYGGVQRPQLPVWKTLRAMNVGELADYWRYAEEVAESNEADLQSAVGVAEKEADRLWTLLEKHKASHCARFGKLPLDLDLAQLCEDLQPNGSRPGTGKNSLELRKDTPSVIEVGNTVRPRDVSSKLGEELVADSEKSIQSNPREQSGPIGQTVPVEPSTPVGLSNPVEQPALIDRPSLAAQSTPNEHSGSVPQSTAIRPLTPVEQSLPASQLSPADPGPHSGPPIVRLPPHPPNGYTYRLSEPQEGSPLSMQEATNPGSTSTAQANQPSRKRARYRQLQQDMWRWDLGEQRETQAAQEAQSTQLNPAARSFEATQAAKVAQSTLGRRLNPSAQSFEAIITQSILARQLDPAAQPFPAMPPAVATQSLPATPPVVATQTDPIAQSIPVAQAAPATQSTRAVQPISATWSHLAREVEDLFTLTEHGLIRRNSNEPLTIKAYNQIHYGGLGHSAPKGKPYCKGLFRREATMTPPPVVCQPSSPRIQALPYPQALIDDGFSLPPPALPRTSMPYEQTSAQPVTEKMLPERSVPVEGPGLVQQPNGRTPAEAVESLARSLSCASAAMREPRTSEGESSAAVDERRKKRAVVGRLLALRS